MFAIPRTAGWVAQWLEMIDDPEQKIARPRQIYTGERDVDYIADRASARGPRRSPTRRCAGRCESAAGRSPAAALAYKLTIAARSPGHARELRGPRRRRWRRSSAPPRTSARRDRCAAGKLIREFEPGDLVAGRVEISTGGLLRGRGHAGRRRDGRRALRPVHGRDRARAARPRRALAVRGRSPGPGQGLAARLPGNVSRVQAERFSVSAPGGRELEVIAAGPADGATVLVHHGTPGSAHEFWPPHLEQAIARDLRLVAYSRPGYAGSDRDPGRSVASCAADSAAIADALGLERLFTVGGSGGGPHALGCAALLPDRVIAAATIAGVGPTDADDLDWLAGMGDENVAGVRRGAGRRRAARGVPVGGRVGAERDRRLAGCRVAGRPGLGRRRGGAHRRVRRLRRRRDPGLAQRRDLGLVRRRPRLPRAVGLRPRLDRGPGDRLAGPRRPVRPRRPR